ncbi:MAG TPA: DUF3618 domain-containing protein [Actinomycetes bacterium]
MTTESQTSAGGSAANPPKPRTPAEIEADIERTRVRLAGTVDAIADRVKPANVARRGVENVKAKVVDEQGHVRVVPVAVVAVAVTAVVGLVVWRRRR